ncbi:hypothetical protein AB1I68_00105 [Paenibacillus pabuli]|uniref:hypothetical protein n=1 Tax=Paenibacillus pabuli TaxID=1472 RepID=UPI003457CE64
MDTWDRIGVIIGILTFARFTQRHLLIQVSNKQKGRGKMNKYKREGVERFVLTGILSTIALLINSTWASTFLLVVAAYSLITGVIYIKRK